MSAIVINPQPGFNAASILWLGAALDLDPFSFIDTPLTFAVSTDAADRSATRFLLEAEGSPGLVIRAEGTGFTFGAGGAVTGGTVTRLILLDGGVEFARVTGLSQVAAPFAASVTGTSLSAYRTLVSLLDDATAVTGSAVNDVVHVGAGNDTAALGDGTDTLVKWSSGNLTLDGGAGSDRLSFQATTGPAYPAPHATGATVNLATGTGINPYGGTLHLTSVENVIGTDRADTITGDDTGNVIGDGVSDTGADRIDARGGDDTVFLTNLSAGASVAGGSGMDALIFGTHADPVAGGTRPGLCVLDLLAPARNTGAFAGSTLTGFEFFLPSQFAVEESLFVFRGANAGETVYGTDLSFGSALPTGRDQIAGRGGDDTLDGLSGNDLLNGGTGNDSLQGGDGLDTLLGGTGADILEGGTGRDVFVYADARDSLGAPARRDLVTDFNTAADRIDLTAIDAVAGGADDAFTLISGRLTGAGQVRVFLQGANTVIQASTDADAAAELVIVLADHHALGTANFVF